MRCPVGHGQFRGRMEALRRVVLLLALAASLLCASCSGGEDVARSAGQIAGWYAVTLEGRTLDDCYRIGHERWPGPGLITCVHLEAGHWFTFSFREFQFTGIVPVLPGPERCVFLDPKEGSGVWWWQGEKLRLQVTSFHGSPTRGPVLMASIGGDVLRFQRGGVTATLRRLRTLERRAQCDLIRMLSDSDG